MTAKTYECPMCGANVCKEVELNIFHCSLCDMNFDIEEMGLEEPEEEPK